MFLSELLPRKPSAATVESRTIYIYIYIYIYRERERDISMIYLAQYVTQACRRMHKSASDSFVHCMAPSDVWNASKIGFPKQMFEHLF